MTYVAFIVFQLVGLGVSPQWPRSTSLCRRGQTNLRLVIYEWTHVVCVCVCVCARVCVRVRVRVRACEKARRQTTTNRKNNVWTIHRGADVVGASHHAEPPVMAHQYSNRRETKLEKKNESIKNPRIQPLDGSSGSWVQISQLFIVRRAMFHQSLDCRRYEPQLLIIHGQGSTLRSDRIGRYRERLC